MEPNHLKRHHSNTNITYTAPSPSSTHDPSLPVRKKSRFGDLMSDVNSATATAAAPTPAPAPAHAQNNASQTNSHTSTSLSDTIRMPPPPPSVRPMSALGGVGVGGGGLVGVGLPLKKPIIMAKGFNIFAKKSNGFASTENVPTITKPKPFVPLNALGPLPTAAPTVTPPALTATAAPTTATAPSAAPVEIDPLEAFMTGLAGNMTDAERKAINGETEAEERRRNAEENRIELAQRQQQQEANNATGTGDDDTQMADANATPNTKSSIPSQSSTTPSTNPSSSPAPPHDRSSERYFGDEDQVDESVIEHHNKEAESGLSWLEKQSKIKKKEIKPVDHAKMNYQPFRKDFYIESKEISSMTDDAVRVYRETTMEGVKIRGKNCPKPIRSWLHCGLPDRVYTMIQKEGYKAPFPIQQQAIPAIMSGRDVLACARTGSGKTLAFVLPMLRHVLDQPLVSTGEGPIAIILAPTRELATQIFNECKKFCKPLNLRVVCVYGGASVGEQIAQLKRGAEIIVATPGRMIDMLVCNKGNLTNLLRTTYVVLDEADRMFDMGFEPQVCLAGSTLVTHGSLLSRPIASLAKIADTSSTTRVYGFDGRHMRLSQPQAWSDSGRQECIRIELEDGRHITCTPNHRLMTPTGWIEARDLQLTQSRVLCSIQAIPDTIDEDERGWSLSLDVGEFHLTLDSDIERDRTFAFMRILGSYCANRIESSTCDHHKHTYQHELTMIDDIRLLVDDSIPIDTLPLILSVAFDTLLLDVADVAHQTIPIPSFLLTPLTPKSIIREFTRSMMGVIADAPSINAADDGWSRIHLTLPTSSFTPLQQLLTTFDLALHPTTLATPNDTSLNRFVLNDTIAFAERLGFVHAAQKSFRLAATVAFLRRCAIHSSPSSPHSPVSPRDFFFQAGCIESMDGSMIKQKLPQLDLQHAIPTFHLAVTSITPAGIHPTYDIQVSDTHSFLAADCLVHNCKIIENVRPDRQTVLFSATFPKSIEHLAKKTLKNPIEIIVGGRSVASSTITQFVEVREASTKFPRLLEILGKWYKLDQCILIFVDKQEAVDQLFRQLNDAGYPCAALHGGMDQSDREFTIADFHSKIRTIMVATSIVSRGLDVKDLTLVVNYEVPNHYEDYVHRVGRTGRAGKAGTAITFIEPDQLKYAPDLVKGLVAAKQIVPRDLQAMADTWNKMRKEGKVTWGSNDGFHSGSGYTFDEVEAAENQNQRRLLKMAENPDADLEELQAISEDVRALEEAKKAKAASKNAASTSADAASASTAGTATESKPTPAPQMPRPSAAAAAAALDPIARQIAIAKKAAMAAAQAMAAQGKLLLGGDSATAQAADAKVAEAVAKAKEQEERRQHNLAASAAQIHASKLVEKLMSGKNTTVNKPPTGITAVGDEEKRAFSVEIEINDYPQHARWKVTHKGALDSIIDETGCAVITKGGFVQQGRNPPPGERKLHLLVEGRTEMEVQRCRSEIMRILEEAAADSRPEPTKYAKYSVI